MTVTKTGETSEVVRQNLTISQISPQKQREKHDN